MKRYPYTDFTTRRLLSLVLAAGLALPLPALAISVTLATSPMATSSSSTVLPNLLFVLDDSGSMAWQHMPDDSTDGGSSVTFSYGYYGLRSSQCNQVYYDPDITNKPYLLPVYANGTDYPNASFTAALPDGYKAATSGGSNDPVNLNTSFKASTDLNGDSTGQSAYYYAYTGSQSSNTQRDYNSTSNTFYNECHSASGATPGSTVFSKRRLATTETTTVTVGGTGGTSSPYASVSGITVNGLQIMKAASATASGISSSTMATNIAAQINLCTATASGNCTTTGYSASVSGSVVTITGPTSAANYTPIIGTSGGMGSITLTTDVFPDTDSAKLQNFANWYSYYRTRMLMMKTAAGRAFKALDNHYRVGFMAMNHNSSFLNVATFDSGQKTSWYTNLYAVVPGSSTPLRTALSNAGRLFAGKLTLTGVTVNDPVQYSCQQNFAILSTDGFWNTGNGFKVDGSTAVGNQDGTADRPMYDGGLFTKTTTQLKQTEQQVSQSTAQTQQRTLQIQKQISQLQQDVGTSQYQTSTLQTRAGTLQGTLSKVLMRCNNTSATCGTAPASGVANANWSVVASGSCAAAANVQCSIVSGLSGSSNVASTCNTSATISSTNAQITITVSGVSSSTRISSIKIDSVEILTGTTSNSNNDTNSKVATNIQAKVGNGYSATVSGSVVTVTKSGTITASSTITTYSVSAGAATLTGSATGATYTLNNADSNGKVYSACSYSWGSWTNAVSACSVNKSSSNPYTVTSATDCQYTSWSGWSNGACTAAAQDNTNLTARQCQYTWANAQGTPSCSTPAYVAGNYSNATVYRNCATAVTSAWSNAASCTVNATPDSNGYTTDCRTTDTGWVGVSSCNPSGPTNGQTISCQQNNTGPTLVASCTPATAASGNSWTTTTCTTNTLSLNLPVASCACTPAANSSCTVAASSSNSYTTTTCSSTTTTLSSQSSCTAQAATAGNNYTSVTCGSTSGTGTSDTLADVAMYYYQTDLRDTALSNCTGALGAGTDVCENNVFIGGTDKNVKQHMDLFTLALGASGKMIYSSPDYMNDTSGDFYSVKTGALASSSANPPICSWQSNGTVCNWPVPGMVGSDGKIENLDDLWHAAVNGRGTYFSATSPDLLASGLSTALTSITARKGAAAAAATSTLNPVAGNNYAYVASYTTVKWTGNLESRSINVDTGVIAEAATWCVENIVSESCASPGFVQSVTSGSSTVTYCVTPDATGTSCTGTWDGTNCSVQIATSCIGTLPTKVGAATDTRTIYTANDAGTSLIAFDTAYQAAHTTYFDAAHINTLSQWSSLTAAQQTAAAGANLLKFLRGQNGFEKNRSANAASNWLYRYREAVLGDALESQPVYLSKPVFSYADLGYSGFFTAQTAKADVAAGTVYMGTNDGMLHAFAADTGLERWAYVPSMVIPNMWKLADTSYDTKHVNFVNGSAVTSDVCVAHCTDAALADWRTILVGGLNGGGHGYYALDITNPATPALLWEFTPTQDANLGYSFGNPVITKKNNGTWVVLVTSGYDNGTLSGDAVTNNSPAGDGKGYLYVLNALTGAKISAISTGVGSAATPSGLGKIAAWSNDPTSNLAGYVYGGDLQGNVWRFDINTAAAPLQFAILKDPSGVTQPITTVPVLGNIDNKRVIFIGTGKYLESNPSTHNDLSDTQVQSEYAIKDDDATATLTNPGGSPRNSTTLVQQTITTSGASRTATNNTVNFNTGRGWYVDFPVSGERVNIDSKLVLGTLLVPTIVPSSTVCSPGGTGWLNYFNYATGGAVDTTTNIVSAKYDTPIVGVNVIYIQGSPVVEVVTATNPTPEIPTDTISFSQTGGNFSAKRVLWRELIP